MRKAKQNITTIKTHLNMRVLAQLNSFGINSPPLDEGFSIRAGVNLKNRVSASWRWAGVCQSVLRKETTISLLKTVKV